MNLILLGAPGAGTGTQADMLAAKLQIPTISTGNMLREAMANGSDLGKQVKQAMDEGKLVSDELVLGIVKERTAKPDCQNGFILDGVPRTLSQAEALDAAGIPVDYVISIEIDDSVIEDRMTGRRVCPQCGASYHVANNRPTVDGICNRCGSELVRRKDDAPETVRDRLTVYHSRTEVLKDYYARQGKLLIVNGNQSVQDTNRDILTAIGAKV